MTEEKTSTNGTVKISFPGRWLVAVSIPVFAVAGVSFQSTWSQGETFDRALLVHAAEKHKSAASAQDLQRVEYVQESLGEDVSELQGIVKDLTREIQNLIVALRANNLSVSLRD